MAKKYTEAQWEKRMSRLPVEDRVAYADSPNADVAVSTTTPVMGAVQRGEYSATAPTPRPVPTPTPTPELTRTSTVMPTSSANVREDRVSPQTVSKPKQEVVPQIPVGSPLPGPGGTSVGSEKTLAEDTFVNTLSLLIGKEEASKPYVKKLYSLAASYYKSGSAVDEAMNLALRQAKEEKVIPEFTQRFRGIFALEDMRRKGIPVAVPTIAEYIKSQEQLAEVFKIAGLGDLANEEFLNDVLSTGKSVRESTSIIEDVFNAIDLAPEEVKQQIRRDLPFADRTTLAKAILAGERGVRELEQLRSRSEIKAAAGGAGLSLTDQAAQELANAGFTYRTSLPKFGQAKQISERGTFLSELSGGPAVTQQQAIRSVFDQTASDLETIGKIEERERLRFQGRSGAAGFASQTRGQAGKSLF